MWQYVGTDPKLDPTLNQSLFDKTYEFMRMVPAQGDSLVYDVEFVSKKDTIRRQVAPVFTGKLKTRNAERFAEKMKRFNAQLKQQEKIRNQQRNEAKLLRVFTFNKLGIYNYDRQLKEENVIPILASFTFGGKPHADYPEACVYLVPKGKLVVVQYTVGNRGSLRTLIRLNGTS